MPKTYYYVAQGDSNYKNATLYNIIHQSPTEDGEDTNVATYWLASRCADTYSNYCSFYVSIVDFSYVSSALMFRSRGGTNGFSLAVRPVINLNSGIQAEYAGEYNGEYNSWTLK